MNYEHDDVLFQLMVPNYVLAANPGMAEILHFNQDKLMGPYDVYEVLHWIATGGATTSDRPLKTRNKTLMQEQFFLDKNGNPKKLSTTSPTPPLDNNIPLNFFTTKISPSRTVEEAGLPKNVWRRSST